MNEHNLTALLYGVFIGDEDDDESPNLPDDYLELGDDCLDPIDWLEETLQPLPRVHADFFRGGIDSRCRYFIYTDKIPLYGDEKPKMVKMLSTPKDADRLLKEAMGYLGVDPSTKQIGWWLTIHCPF